MLHNFKVFQQADQSSPLYAKGVARVPEGQFEYDAFNDKLPAVYGCAPLDFSRNIRIICRRTELLS